MGRRRSRRRSYCIAMQYVYVRTGPENDESPVEAGASARAGYGNRTRLSSLGSSRSTDELIPLERQDRSRPATTLGRRMRRTAIPLVAVLAVAALVGAARLRRRPAKARTRRSTRRSRRASGPPRPTSRCRCSTAPAQRSLADLQRQGRRPELLGLVVRAVQGRGAGARARPEAPGGRRRGHRARRDLQGRRRRLARSSCASTASRTRPCATTSCKLAPGVRHARAARDVRDRPPRAGSSRSRAARSTRSSSTARSTRRWRTA